MKSITKIPKLENIPVLVRTALNVPVENGVVVNSFRLRKALPTIEYLRKKHARVILIGHIGEKGTETLEPVYRAMKEFIPGLVFCPVTIGATARKAVRDLPAGGVLMLENLRRDVGETKNSPQFATALAELADVFVEDSFDVCHREHASVVGVPKLLAAYAGLQLLEEVSELTKALKPVSPSLAIIGGAKFSTKEPVLTALLNSYDRVFVGGALANDFMLASGHSVGKSLVSAGEDELGIRRLLRNPRLMLPIDEVVALPENDVTKSVAVGLDSVPAEKSVYDDGPKTVEALAALASKAKTVLWNGPLGMYEKGFTGATEGLAKAIAASNAYAILGGGDTVAVVENLNLSHRFSFISTGGGAMLDFLAKGTLPGLDALN
ncbi:MAG: Phosphoglycerate kinase [Parcubacteria group bacterium]|nr:Phosphoglycerate kinase [Parcubacteria group bacterium]